MKKKGNAFIIGKETKNKQMRGKVKMTGYSIFMATKRFIM